MELFREVRNQYTQSVRKAKASFFKQKSASCGTNSKKFWDSRYISLVIPKANTPFGRLSFQFSAANDWNELQKLLKLETCLPH